MTQGLVKRNHTWNVRYVIPRSDRAKYGGTESVTRTLKTRDLDEARKKKHAKVAEIIEELDAKYGTLNGLLKEAHETAIELASSDDPDLLEILMMPRRV